jgi:hypothetical protein
LVQSRRINVQATMEYVNKYRPVVRSMTVKGSGVEGDIWSAGNRKINKEDAI